MKKHLFLFFVSLLVGVIKARSLRIPREEEAAGMTRWNPKVNIFDKEISQPIEVVQNTVEDFITKNIEGSTTPSTKIIQAINSLKDLADSDEELAIYYQDTQDEERHVKSRFPLVQNEIIQREFQNEKITTEGLDVMFSDVQERLNRMQKYLKSICQKHRHSSIGNSTESKMLKKEKKFE